MENAEKRSLVIDEGKLEAILLDKISGYQHASQVGLEILVDRIIATVTINTRASTPEADCKEIIAVIDSFNLDDDFDIAARNKLRSQLQKSSQPEAGKGFEEWWSMIIDRDMDGDDSDTSLKAEYLECWNAALSSSPAPLATKEEGKCPAWRNGIFENAGGLCKNWGSCSNCLRRVGWKNPYSDMYEPV